MCVQQFFLQLICNCLVTKGFLPDRFNAHQRLHEQRLRDSGRCMRTSRVDHCNVIRLSLPFSSGAVVCCVVVQKGTPEQKQRPTTQQSKCDTFAIGLRRHVLPLCSDQCSGQRNEWVRTYKHTYTRVRTQVCTHVHTNARARKYTNMRK